MSADSSSQTLSTWICIEPNCRGLAELDLRNVIFIDVAEHPNGRQISDSEDR